MAAFPHDDGLHAATHTHRHPNGAAETAHLQVLHACRLDVGNGGSDVEQHQATTVVASGHNRVLMRALVPQQATAAAHVRPASAAPTARLSTPDLTATTVHGGEIADLAVALMVATGWHTWTSREAWGAVTRCGRGGTTEATGKRNCHAQLSAYWLKLAAVPGLVDLALWGPSQWTHCHYTRHQPRPLQMQQAQAVPQAMLRTNPIAA